jgi:long-chain fatty acid transport protein
MTLQRTVLRAAAALALGTALLPAHATNGYFPHGFGLKAKGMGGAATALAQDAFAGVNNPAASAFAGNRWDLGGDIFMPDRSMNRTFNGSPTASAESDRKVFLIPEFGYNQTISDRLSWGVTVYGNGGMNTTYPATSNVLNGTGQLGVDLMQLVVAPTVAYKLNDRHSLGVSPLLVYQRFKAFGLDGFGSISSDSTKLTNKGADSSTGLGVRLGYMGRLSDTLSIGASYSPKIGMSRFKDYAGLFAEGGDFDIPENYTLGLAVQATPALLFAMDYQRINYSGVASIGNPSSNMAPLGAANGPGFGWRDINVWKIGAQWQFNPTWTLRAGYSKGQNPVTPANVSFNILAPGVVTDHITLGATMQMDKQSELTFTYMHARNNEVSGASLFNNPMFGGSGGTAIQETIRMKQNSIGIQYSRKF